MVKLGRVSSFCIFIAFVGIATAGAQTFQPGGPSVVRDSAGHVVGQYDGVGQVSVNINGHVVYLDVQRSNLSIDGVNLYFDQPNCQGNAFLKNDEVPYIVSTPAAFAPDGTVRIAPSHSTTSKAVASYYFDETGQCTNQASTITALATEAGPNVKNRFTPDFGLTFGSIPAVVVDAPTNSYFLLGAIAAAVLLIALLRLR